MRDIFSRYVVGWLLARQEAAAPAKVLITESCQRHRIPEGRLVIHADRGPSTHTFPMPTVSFGLTTSAERRTLSLRNGTASGPLRGPASTRNSSLGARDDTQGRA